MVRGIFFLCGTHLQYTLFLIERGRTQKRVVTSISWRRRSSSCIISLRFAWCPTKTSTSQKSTDEQTKPGRLPFEVVSRLQIRTDFSSSKSNIYMYRRLRLAEQISGWARPFMQPRKQGLADCSPRPEACDAAKQGSSKIIISDPFST